MKETKREGVLIADGGSTKTGWTFCRNGETISLLTGGINPIHQTEAEITDRLPGPEWPEGVFPAAVRYYGAGCVPAHIEVMEKLLRKRFPGAAVRAASDLAGAARALCGKAPGIVAILGTGSNSGVWDGEGFTAHVPPLGYILGDEGSGAALGKRLVADYLKGLLPERMANLFREKYGNLTGEIIESVYRKPEANRYLASFAPFLAEFLNESPAKEIAAGVFREFIERNLLRYPCHRDLPVHFTGSVAFRFSALLQEILLEYGMRPGKIDASPMKGLIEYHTRYE